MRRLVWLSGVLLALSCSVDNSNLNVDAGSGTGGAGGDACPRCVSTGGSGGNATGGAVGSGGAVAGAPGTGGVATGTGGGAAGQSGTGGGVAGAGGSGTGGGVAGAGGNGTGGGAGGNGTGGKGTGGKGAGGATGTGGKGSGGTTGTGGQGGSPSCDTLTTEYTTALAAAKVCTPGATGQCQQMVDSSISCPGCQTYVNDTTTLDTIVSEWTAAGCDKMHFVCPAIACVVPGPASCQTILTPGNGGPAAGTTGMCSSALTPTARN
jgi:hypothetical protein